MEKKTGLLNNALLWLGASVSIAEIVTGALFAPLGFSKGLLAVIIGHVIGCTLFYLAGLIGAKTGMSGMESTGFAFGKSGSKFFAGLNVLQLLGWTAVMIISGARALSSIISPIIGVSFFEVSCVIIGVLIIIWQVVGVENLGVINTIAVGALVVLSIVLSVIVFSSGQSAPPPESSLSFGMAVELAAIMPLSWLPLVSDYTRLAKKPIKATAVSTLAYFAGSTWMYVIGLGAAVFAGNSDVAVIMPAAGLTLWGAVIVVFSTVTTTFLDVNSAGVSFQSITKKLPGNTFALVATAVCMVFAIVAPIDQYESFLYFIGSVFVPMIAVLMTDFFILKRSCERCGACKRNMIVWAVGLVIYRVFLYVNLPIGAALPAFALTVLLCLIANLIHHGQNRKEISNV